MTYWCIGNILRLTALFPNWPGSILPIPDMTQVETLFQCVIIEDDARSGDWGHDWTHVLNRPRPHDRDKKDPRQLLLPDIYIYPSYQFLLKYSVTVLQF